MGNVSRWLSWQSGANSAPEPATKPAKPELRSAFGDARAPTKPAKPAKPSAEPGWTPIAVVAHAAGGENFFGQKAEKYPYCIVERAQLRQGDVPFRSLRWFQTRGDAVTYLVDTNAATQPNICITRLSASFAGEKTVVLRRDGPSRWVMYVNGTRRRDFASPYLDHGRRTAEYWFGKPDTDWTEEAR